MPFHFIVSTEMNIAKFNIILNIYKPLFAIPSLLSPNYKYW